MGLSSKYAAALIPSMDCREWFLQWAQEDEGPLPGVPQRSHTLIGIKGMLAKQVGHSQLLAALQWTQFGGKSKSNSV